jgi:hypothetical protein
MFVVYLIPYIVVLDQMDNGIMQQAQPLASITLV